jgi:ElaA protein
MSIRWQAKPFQALTLIELHDVLRLREDIFVVEQRCVYHEIDGRDPNCLHLLGHDAGLLVAVARIVPPGDDGLPHIGRVAVRAEHRGRGLAQELMDLALRTLLAERGSRRAALAAQAHLQRFYAEYGFEAIGEEYLWDGIPHVDMRRTED